MSHSSPPSRAVTRSVTPGLICREATLASPRHGSSQSDTAVSPRRTVASDTLKSSSANPEASNTAR